MPRIEWDDALATGIATVDMQHQKLVVFLQKLDEALRGTLTDEQIYTSILDMMEYASVHFATEEKLMAPHGERMPSHEEHLRQHKEFMQLTLEMMDRFRLEGKSLGRELCTFVGSWIVTHIKVMDKSMQKELHALGVL